MKFASMVTNHLSLLTKLKNRKVITFFIHLVVLSIIFVVPEILASLSRRGVSTTFTLAPYLKSIIWVSAFYISYYLTTDPSTGRRSDIAKYLIQNLLILAGAIIAMDLIWEYFRPEFKPEKILKIPAEFRPKPHHGPGLGFIARDSLVTVLAIALALALKILDKLRVMEKRQRESQEREREAELQQLKAQLNPHFLFNTLNSIYALIDISPEKARDSIHRLSRMLRYMLYENPSTVALGDEIRFLESYVELMRLRLPTSIPAIVTLDANGYNGVPIAPMLFINILENAFKHGTHASKSGPITINLHVDNGIVTCFTSNAYDKDRTTDRSSGIGLSNLRRRLELQYPGRHNLTVTTTDSYNVSLKIDISSPPEMSPLQTKAK